jgi:uncharacterized membrane protein (GlpM family)
MAQHLGSGTSTTILWAVASKFPNYYCNFLIDLAPQLAVLWRTLSISAGLSNRITQNCGSWA